MNGKTVVENRSLRKWWLEPAMKSACPEAAIFCAVTPPAYLGRFASKLERVHRKYGEDRARDVPEARSWGGVGGTRVGVKCLHAHYAYFLAGGDDPVGRWVEARLTDATGARS